MITANKLAQAMGIGDDAAALWIQHVQNALELCNCRTPEHVAMWIAQVGHESAGLTRLRESLNYSVEALLTRFGRHRISEEDARKYGRTATRPANQPAIAECLYGGAWGLENLGNRPGTDDAWRRIGRGPIQCTGYRNQVACGKSIGVDLETSPELLETRSVGAQSTAYFWRLHKITGFNADVKSVTKRITGGSNWEHNGLAERQAIFNRALPILK